MSSSIRAYVAVAFEGPLDDNSLKKISKRGLLNSKTDTETAKAYINQLGKGATRQITGR